jgi:hypothetical protein
LSYFEENLARLASRQPGLAAELSKAPSKNVTVFPSVCGIPSARYEHGASSVALHSRYDPLREARQIVKKQDTAETDYFILLGFGLGYLLDALLEEDGAACNRYFIIESDLEILRAAFEARDLTPILSLSHLHFAWPAAGAALAEQWQKFFDPVQAQKSTFITHLPSVVLDPPLFKSAAEMIQSQTFQIFTDINTLVGKAEAFLDNFISNVHKAAQAPGVVFFSRLFAGVPAVVVSAGPSLDKNIHELRGCEENALILSTDTALKPLLAAGIDPHFVLTGDPSHINYLHLKGAPIQKALVVAEASSYPGVFDEFAGKIVSCTFENSSLRSLSDLLGNKGSLRAWGSVATMALDFALLLECDPVIFVGQDLAHTDGRIYCTGTCFDDEWFADVNNREEWARKLETLRSSRRTVVLEDIFGKPIESTDKLIAYWNWMIKSFQDHLRVRFINATEGGILKDHVMVASLRESLHCYCRAHRNLRKRVADAYADSQRNRLLYPGVDLSALLNESSTIRHILRAGLHICELSSPPIQSLMNQLEETKESIYRNTHLAPLVDSLNQMGNVTFLRKRNSAVKRASSADLRSEIGGIYTEYFNSVREALSKIDKALIQIAANLNEKSTSSSRARNNYSNMPRLTIR